MGGEKIKALLLTVLGSAILAFGLYNVHSLSAVTEGGILGLTLLLEHWTGVSPALSSFVMNTACYLLGWRTFGKEFLAYSFLAAWGYSLGYSICEQYPPLWPGIAGMPLLAALLGAAFIGIGAGLCVQAGGATTGDDALAMSLSHITKIPIERIYLVSDLTVLTLSLSYIPLKRIIYSLITVILSGQIIGWIQKIHAKKRLD